MRTAAAIASLLCAVAAAECVPFDQAQRHIGERQCVTGRVLRVEMGNSGVHYFDFCEDYRLCPFSVVIFPHDLKNVGDVRQLAGKLVEVRGQVQEYDGRAEIILESRKQLNGGSTGIPALPSNFDVEQRGHFSAGKFRPAHQKRSKRRRRPTVPIEIPEDPEQD